MQRKRPGAGPSHRGHGGRAETKDACEKRKTSSRTSNSKQYSVTDGRTALRTIKLIGGSYVAIDATGQTLGTLATLRAAVASFGRPQ